MMTLRLIITLIWVFAATSTMAAVEPSTSLDQTQFVERPHKSFDQLLLRADLNSVDLQKLYVEQPSISFRRHWVRDQRRIHSLIDKKDIERVKTRYANALQEVLMDKLESTGHTLTTDPKLATLIIKSALVKLDINAPDFFDAVHVDKFVERAGRGTLRLEVVSTTNNQSVLQIEDRGLTRLRDFRYAHRATSVSNLWDFKHLMSRWASDFASYLGTLSEGTEKAPL